MSNLHDWSWMSITHMLWQKLKYHMRQSQGSAICLFSVRCLLAGLLARRRVVQALSRVVDGGLYLSRFVCLLGISLNDPERAEQAGIEHIDQVWLVVMHQGLKGLVYHIGSTIPPQFCWVLVKMNK